MSADATKERVRQWCDWFDLPMPKVRVRNSSVYLTDELYAWMSDAGASYDWIFCGKMHEMACSYRKAALSERSFMKTVRHLDENESRILEVYMRSTLDGTATVDDAVAAMTQAITEYRQSA